KYYEAGMDLGLSYDRSESFKLFQARILEGYDKMVDSDNFVVLDGTLPVNKLQKQMRDIVANKIDLKRFAPQAANAERACPSTIEKKTKRKTRTRSPIRSLSRLAHQYLAHPRNRPSRTLRLPALPPRRPSLKRKPHSISSASLWSALIPAKSPAA